MEAQSPLRIFFLPAPAMGHMIPLINVAKLFSRHGIAATLIATANNEPLIRPAISNTSIDLILVPFPQLLPNGKENFSHTKTGQENNALAAALYNLKKPIEDLLRTHRPDCLVSDGFFSWSSDVAVSLGIPRIIFNVIPIFSMSVIENIRELPIATDESPEVLAATDGLPNRIEIARTEIANLMNPIATQLFRDSERNSFGILYNTFYELEKEYIDLYRKNHRAWCIGPLSLVNESTVVDTQKLHHRTRDCLIWLDTISPERSVVYACFGSLNEFSADQLRDIALALEASGHPFVWVVSESLDTNLWLPEGFEVRTKGKGFLIRGWVPQDTILNHPAIGGFVTHCGSNSALEGVTAGLPMVTWPLMHDQFIIEKFITDVLKIGVSADRGRKLTEAVQVVMGSEEGVEMRRRSMEYGVKAKEAMEVGGSSYGDLTSLIDELRKYPAAGRGESAK